MSTPPKLLWTTDPSTIHSEEDPDYYSNHVFVVDLPEGPYHTLRWLEQIGPANVKHIKMMRLDVHAFYLPSFDDEEKKDISWYTLLKRLAAYATGLRDLEVCWETGDPAFLHEGGGADTRFVRMLGEIQGLETLTIDGYFAKEWPGYLERRMGVCPILKQKDETYLEQLKKYQQRLEDIVL